MLSRRHFRFAMCNDAKRYLVCLPGRGDDGQMVPGCHFGGRFYPLGTRSVSQWRLHGYRGCRGQSHCLVFQAGARVAAVGGKLFAEDLLESGNVGGMERGAPKPVAPYQKIIGGQGSSSKRDLAHTTGHRAARQPKQDSAQLQGRPDGAIDDLTIAREVAFIDQADGPRGRSDGAAPWGQQPATHQSEHMLEGWPGEGAGEGAHERRDNGRGVGMTAFPLNGLNHPSA